VQKNHQAYHPPRPSRHPVTEVFPKSFELSCNLRWNGLKSELRAAQAIIFFYRYKFMVSDKNCTLQIGLPQFSNQGEGIDFETISQE